MPVVRQTTGIGLVLAGVLASGATVAAPVPAPTIVTDPKAAAAGDYKLDPHHASVTVKLSHMGLSFYTLRFDGIQGRYAYEPTHPEASPVEIVIDPRSIDTGDKAFDQLIANRYLEAEKYPAIRFTSTRIAPAGDRGSVEGILDFHGVRKPVTLAVTYRGFVNMQNQQWMGFSGETRFKRSDFGVDAYVPAEGDEVRLLIEVEFIRARIP